MSKNNLSENMDYNPYAMPSDEFGYASAGHGGDAERIRNELISHEASIKSISVAHRNQGGGFHVQKDTRFRRHGDPIMQKSPETCFAMNYAMAVHEITYTRESKILWSSGGPHARVWHSSVE